MSQTRIPPIFDSTTAAKLLGVDSARQFNKIAIRAGITGIILNPDNPHRVRWTVDRVEQIREYWETHMKGKRGPIKGKTRVSWEKQ